MILALTLSKPMRVRTAATDTVLKASTVRAMSPSSSPLPVKGTVTARSPSVRSVMAFLRPLIGLMMLLAISCAATRPIRIEKIPKISVIIRAF